MSVEICIKKVSLGLVPVHMWQYTEALLTKYPEAMLNCSLYLHRFPDGMEEDKEEGKIQKDEVYDSDENDHQMDELCVGRDTSIGYTLTSRELTQLLNVNIK